MRGALMLVLLSLGCGGDDVDDSDDNEIENPAPDDPDTPCNEENEACDAALCGEDDEDEENMLPGSACLTCHSEGEMPEDDEPDKWFSAAGTVYLDADGFDPAQDVTIRIVDRDDMTIEFTSNSAGNFYTTDAFEFPAEVEIEVDGNILAMVGKLQDGNCNRCHACTGTAERKLQAP